MLHQSMLSLSRLSRRSLVGRAGALAATLSLSARSTRAAQEATPTARPASPTPEGQFANINGAELYYVLEGPEDGPPVLLLHGGIGNTEEFRNVAPALVAAGYRTIAFDQRGRGRSTWGDQPITYEQMAADTVAVLDKLGIERTDVIGWSDGGIVALELAVTHPERLKRVVAYGANSRPEGSYAEPQMSDQMPPFEDFIADYQRLSPAPERFEELLGVLGDLYKVAPNFTDFPERRVTSITSARDSLSSSSATRASIQPCCSLAEWYSAFSDRSPWARASSMALMIRGRSTDFRCFTSSIIAAWPAAVIGTFSIAVLRSSVNFSPASAFGRSDRADATAFRFFGSGNRPKAQGKVPKDERSVGPRTRPVAERFKPLR